MPGKTLRPNWAYEPKPSTKTVKKLIKSERKAYEKKVVELGFHEVVNGYTLLGFNTTVTDISGIPQGTGDTERKGDKCMPRSIDLRGWINGETFSSVVRIVIIRWNPVTVPVHGDVFFSADGNATTCLSPFVHDQRDQFQYVYDKTFTVSNNGGSEIIHFQKHIKLGMKAIDFSGGSTTGSHKYYVYALTDRSTVTSALLRLYTRMNFTDQ